MSKQHKNKIISPERRDFSRRFHKIRKQKGLSQQEMSEMLGFSANSQVWKFENGTSEPSLDVLRKLVKALYPDPIDIHELVTGETSPVAKHWRDEYHKLLSLLAKYISNETTRLLDERHRLWGDLGVAQEKLSKKIVGADKHVQFLESELHRIEERISDVAENQHYVEEALSSDDN